MNAAARELAIASGIFEEPIFGIKLQCPHCGCNFDPVSPAKSTSERWGRCSGCFYLIGTENGIWKALPPERESYFQRFILEYQAIRAAEGRGSRQSEYYLALPYRDLSRRNQFHWAIRSRTFGYIRNKLLPSMETAHPQGLNVLDLGAGNCWLSYRLALRGHRPVAVDLLTNEQDGLGAAEHFRSHLPELFPRFQAELDRLPFAGRQFDLCIFNASLHYSERYEQTLREAIRCLRPGGTIIIADTAWYRHEESGRQMLAERRQAFILQYGFASDDIRSLEYLTDDRLHALEQQLGFRWQVHSPFYGLKWAIRPLMATLRGKRKPSRFRIYVAVVAK